MAKAQLASRSLLTDIEVIHMDDTSQALAVVAAKHGVTDAGVRLLEVISNPESRLLTIADKCRKAGISRDWYYQLQRDPRYIAAYRELCDMTVLHSVLPSIQTLEQAALRDPAAAVDMLKLSGYYQPTARVEHTHTHEAGPSLKEILSRRQA